MRKMIQKQPPRQFSKYLFFFFQEQPFYNFPGGSICSSNRHEFSRRFILCSSNRHQFSRRAIRKTFSERFYLFVEPYYLIGQIIISRRPYLVLEHEGTPSRTDISLIGLGGCFRRFSLPPKKNWFIFFYKWNQL